MTLATHNQHKKGPAPTNTGDRASNPQKLPVRSIPVSAATVPPAVSSRGANRPVGELFTGRPATCVAPGSRNQRRVPVRLSEGSLSCQREPSAQDAPCRALSTTSRSSHSAVSVIISVPVSNEAPPAGG